MIRQFVPSHICLKCTGCCRYAEQDTVWSPVLLDEETFVFMEQNHPSVFISAQRRLLPLPVRGGDGFACPFLKAEENRCAVYATRPFECQLYPFLINLRKNKVVLTVDLNCPYVQAHINSPEFKEYVQYLGSFLNSPQQRKLLRENPQIIQAYEKMAEVIELRLDDGTT